MESNDTTPIAPDFVRIYRETLDLRITRKQADALLENIPPAHRSIYAEGIEDLRTALQDLIADPCRYPAAGGWVHLSTWPAGVLGETIQRMIQAATTVRLTEMAARIQTKYAAAHRARLRREDRESDAAIARAAARLRGETPAEETPIHSAEYQAYAASIRARLAARQNA